MIGPRSRPGGAPLLPGLFPPGPTAAYQLLVSTGIGVVAWFLNPLLSAGANIFGRILPGTIDQNRAYAIGAAHDYDIALGASTENAFSVVINTNDGANRRTLRYMCDARRVGGAGTSGVALVPLQTDPLWALVAAANVNTVRFTLTNGTGLASRVSFYAEPLVTPNVAAP